VGAGQVGRRKIATLLDCGAAEVLVVDTAPAGEELQPLLGHPALKFECRRFEPGDLDDRFLVIASTSDENLNLTVSRLCKQRNIMVNVVDQPEKCNFILPALCTVGDLTMAISTGGSSPALARAIRLKLTESFGPEWGVMADLMGRLRPIVLKLGMGSEENGRLFRALVESPLMERIRAKDKDGAVQTLNEHLPREIHAEAAGIANELLQDT